MQIRYSAQRHNMLMQRRIELSISGIKKTDESIDPKKFSEAVEHIPKNYNDNMPRKVLQFDIKDTKENSN